MGHDGMPAPCRVCWRSCRAPASSTTWPSGPARRKPCGSCSCTRRSRWTSRATLTRTRRPTRCCRHACFRLIDIISLMSFSLRVFSFTRRNVPTHGSCCDIGPRSQLPFTLGKTQGSCLSQGTRSQQVLRMSHSTMEIVPLNLRRQRGALPPRASVVIGKMCSLCAGTLWEDSVGRQSGDRPGRTRHDSHPPASSAVISLSVHLTSAAPCSCCCYIMGGLESLKVPARWTNLAFWVLNNFHGSHPAPS